MYVKSAHVSLSSDMEHRLRGLARDNRPAIPIFATTAGAGDGRYGMVRVICIGLVYLPHAVNSNCYTLLIQVWYPMCELVVVQVLSPEYAGRYVPASARLADVTVHPWSRCWSCKVLRLRDGLTMITGRWANVLTQNNVRSRDVVALVLSHLDGDTIGIRLYNIGASTRCRSV